ncbi:MAG: TauD/TfdA family dioxygenase [Betaproteobacteria bacterium]|nr:TauD/TfdA family dioxygenase [Betaproteobacteria bacterium]
MATAIAIEPSPLSPGPVGGPAAWKRPEMDRQRDWLHVFTLDELEEIDAAVSRHFADRREMGDISPATFRLPAFAKKLAGFLEDILRGRGFIMLRGFPVERYSMAEAAVAYLGIGSHLGSFRSQNAKGHLLGHVYDHGFDIRKPTTRYYQTNREIRYHSDSCDIVGLLCWRTSKSGGESRIVSSVTLHDEMLRRRPDLWRELFNAFPSDRRGEVPPGMLPWFELSIFNWYAGKLTVWNSSEYIDYAQENHPEARRLTGAEYEARAYLSKLCNDPELNLTIEFRPGDMQFLHNHQISHSRTDFEDWPEPERRRHLLRLWLSPASDRPLPPAFAQRYGSVVPGERGGIITENTTLTFVLEQE